MLVGGASERFRVAGFEGHDCGSGGGGTGTVFLGYIFVLLLEVEHGGVCSVTNVKPNEVKPNECGAVYGIG